MISVVHLLFGVDTTNELSPVRVEFMTRKKIPFKNLEFDRLNLKIDPLFTIYSMPNGTQTKIILTS